MIQNQSYNVTSFTIKPIEMTQETQKQHDGFEVDGDLNQLSDTDLNTLLDRLTAIKQERDADRQLKKIAVINEKIEVLKTRIKADMVELKEIIMKNDLEDDVSLGIDENDMWVEYGDWKAY